jgi:hypothetical protein
MIDPIIYIVIGIVIFGTGIAIYAKAGSRYLDTLAFLLLILGGIFWAIGIISIGLSVQEQTTLQKGIDKNQTAYLDSHSCKDVSKWLSDATHNKLNATDKIIEHARDILISECLK